MITANPLANFPGMTDILQTAEANLLWGTLFHGGVQYLPCIILSSAVDSGNTPTTTLRKGLVLGKITSSGKLKQYDPTSTDGSEIPYGVLLVDTSMLDASGTAVDKIGVVMVAGPVLAASLYPAITTNMRAHMHPRFMLDDDIVGNKNPWRQMVVKTADYTVVAGTDNGKTFITTGASGAVNFTLPAVAAGNVGERYRFISGADQSLTVTAPANKLIIFNNLTATSGAFSTAGNKIGAVCEIMASETGLFWIFIQLCKHTLTVA